MVNVRNFGSRTVFGPDTNELGDLDSAWCDSIGRGLASTGAPGTCAYAVGDL